MDEEIKQRLSFKLESLKMLKEWSVWLIVIQASVCTFLWNILKTLGELSWRSTSLYVAWFAFSLSVVTATLLVSGLPGLIERLVGIPSESSILSNPIRIAGVNVALKGMVVLEHIFFLIGLVFIIIHIAVQALYGTPPSKGAP